MSAAVSAYARHGNGHLRPRFAYTLYGIDPISVMGFVPVYDYMDCSHMLGV